ncbi:reprolysin-like metallopeptidase [Marinicella sp. W31]|uniref:reprolysin-like metallopeptidase n=1 Tax=Marinicella sp. W31 TaxID=3023713 RepID=UPI00375716B4
MSKLFIFLILLFNFTSSISQESDNTQLFRDIEPIVNQELPPYIVSQWKVDINFEALREIQLPNSISLFLPENPRTTLPIDSFNAGDGYDIREEDDPPGPPYSIIPNFPLEKLSYYIVSMTDEYDVVLTIRNEKMSGTIISGTKSYSINFDNTLHSHVLSDIKTSALPENATYDVRDENADVPRSTSNISISNIKAHKVKGYQNTESRSQIFSLDMLVYYTEEARIAEGGNPNVPTDDADILLQIEASINNTNSALSNSLVNSRVTLYYTGKVNGFILSPLGFPAGPRADLENFRTDPIVQFTRTLVGADAVSMIVADTNVIFTVCGIAHAQTIPQCGLNLPACSDQSSFDSYSYNLVNRLCDTEDNTFVHEFGHLLGANHTRAPNNLNQATILGIENNGYPSAFAYDDGTFESIMKIFDNNRRLYFSNPNVLLNGSPTGVAGSEYNVENINLLTPFMTVFRPRNDFIFEDGFE